MSIFNATYISCTNTCVEGVDKSHS